MRLIKHKMILGGGEEMTDLECHEHMMISKPSLCQVHIGWRGFRRAIAQDSYFASFICLLIVRPDRETSLETHI